MALISCTTLRLIVISLSWLKICANSDNIHSEETASQGPAIDHCMNELRDLFGPLKTNRCGKLKTQTTSYVLIFFGEAFRAPHGHQNYREISTDSWIQSQALKSVQAHVIAPWRNHGLQLSRVIAHSYTNTLNVKLLELLEETFTVPVTYSAVRNESDWKAAATLYPGVQLLEPGEHALLFRYDLYFFEELPPPCLGQITLPHCGEIRVSLKSHVADSFAWIPSSKVHTVREYLITNHNWSHNIAEWLKPFSLFYPAHMNVNPRDHKLGQNFRGTSRPYDLMGRTERATPMHNISLNATK